MDSPSQSKPSNERQEKSAEIRNELDDSGINGPHSADSKDNVPKFTIGENEVNNELPNTNEDAQFSPKEKLGNSTVECENTDVSTSSKQKKNSPAADDEGEIVSDGEGGDETVDPNEADSTMISTQDISTLNEEQLNAELTDMTESSKSLQKRSLNDSNVSLGTGSDAGEPQNKKAALEHLRSMKFSKSDPFNESANRDHSLRFNREDRSSEHHDPDSARRKRNMDDDRDRRRRYRHGNSPSSHHVSSSTDVAAADQQQQKRQRGTMYFLMQNNDQHHSQTHNFHHHNLPPSLKGVLQTSGHLKQKLESLLSLKDDQVFCLPAEEMEALLMYTFELSMEQDRLLTGRTAQLKQLDEMIQKERDLIDRIVQEIPSHARPNVSEMLNGNASKSTPNISSAVTSISAINAVNTTPAIAPLSDFSFPPPTFKDSALNPTVPPPTLQFSQPPPALPKLDGAPPPSDFSKPPPLVSSSSAHPKPVLEITPNQMLQPPPPVNAATTPISFSTPPPPIIHTSVTPNVSVPSSQLSVNTSIPPPNIVSMAATSKGSTSLTQMTNLSAPPPPLNFSLPPPNTTDISSSTSIANNKMSLKTSHSSSNISNQLAALGDPAVFNHPPPAILNNQQGGSSSTNITAALDLSVPPPFLTGTLDSKGPSTLFQNLNQTPTVHQLPTTVQSIITSVTASLKQQQSIVTSRASSQVSSSSTTIEQHGLRPLMSIEHPPPNFMHVRSANKPSSSIPSLASLSRNSVTIKRPAKGKNKGGKTAKKNQRKMKKEQNKTVDSTKGLQNLNSGEEKLIETPASAISAPTSASENASSQEISAGNKESESANPSTENDMETNVST